MVRFNNKKIQLLLWLLIVASVMLGIPVIKFGLFILEFQVLKDYINGNSQITISWILLPIAHLSLLFLFPPAKHGSALQPVRPG